MLTVLLLDDEKPALTMLEIQLSYFENIQVIGKHTLYRTFLEDFHKNKPLVVFVDIEMPGRSGLEIAEEIKRANPDTEVIFITAHKQYAYDAFQIDAYDYVLKPFTKERLKKVIDKLENKKNGQDSDSDSLNIRMMKRFEIINKQGEVVHWRTKKTAELLAYLIHNGHKEIDSDFIIEALWPLETAEKARKMLYTTVYYLRKDLERFDTGIYVDTKGKKYILSMKDAACDVDQLDQILCGSCEDLSTIIERIFTLYRGGYLEEDYFEWAESKKIELEERLRFFVLSAAKRLIQEKKLDIAEFALQNLIRIAPDQEYSYKLLIWVYTLQKKQGQSKMLYHTYCQVMTELGLKPESFSEILNDTHVYHDSQQNHIK